MISLPSDDINADDSMMNQRIVNASNLMKDGNIGDSSSIFMPSLVTPVNGLHDMQKTLFSI